VPDTFVHSDQCITDHGRTEMANMHLLRDVGRRLVDHDCQRRSRTR
jgi:hypothetical protein